MTANTSLIDSNALQQRTHWLLVLALLPLHFAIWLKTNIALANTLFLLHIGIFIFWQPFINRKTQIRTRPTIVLLLTIFASIYLSGGWALALWVIFLIGILSSYQLDTRAERLIFYAVIVFLFIQLFGGLVPKLIKTTAASEIPESLISQLALVLLGIIFLAPIKTLHLKNYSSDILYSFITVVIVILIAMTTVIWMVVGKYSYFESLILAFITLAATLIVFNLAFKPNSEFGLIAQYRNRYLLNLGTPFERTLLALAKTSKSVDNTDTYLQAAFDQLTELEWISGFSWQRNGQEYNAGQSSDYQQPYDMSDLTITLHTRQALGAPMLIHARLLIQIIDIFYAAKVREKQLATRAHIQAIHETGARLTHDIKNLVQSLTLMITTANTVPLNEQSDALFKRNLQVITQRLQSTLAKLKNPAAEAEIPMSIQSWWQKTTERYSTNDMLFDATISNDLEIPSEAFTNVIENLLDNGRKKQKEEPDITFSIKLISTEDIFSLCFTDTGNAIPEEIANKLFSEPVSSQSGFGIGLYQASKQIEANLFSLSIKHNEQANVCFEITRIKMNG